MLTRCLSLSLLACLPFTLFAQAPTNTSVGVQVISHLIVMTGYVNDSHKLEVILDTGASVSCVRPDLASQLHLLPMTKVTMGGIAKGSDETAQIFSGARLTWGEAKQFTLDRQNIATLPLAYVSQQTGHPVDALFGSSLFHHYRVRVDYERGEVNFGADGSSAKGGTPLAITLYSNVPYVQASLETETGEKIPALFLVDSGTTGDLLLNPNFLKAHPSLLERHTLVSRPAVTAVGGSIQLNSLRITGLDLGPFRLAGPIAAVPESALGVLGEHDIAGFIGAGILSRFIVDWDYGRKTMTLTPNHHFDEPFESNASGLSLLAGAPAWNTIRVAALTPGSPGAEAGLQTGDLLVLVDGKTPPPLSELNERLSHPGSLITFTVLRAGKRATVTLHLRRLV